MTVALAQIEVEILFIFFFKKMKRLQRIAGLASKKDSETSSETRN